MSTPQSWPLISRFAGPTLVPGAPHECRSARPTSPKPGASSSARWPAARRRVGRSQVSVTAKKSRDFFAESARPDASRTAVGPHADCRGSHDASRDDLGQRGGWRSARLSRPADSIPADSTDVERGLPASVTQMAMCGWVPTRLAAARRSASSSSAVGRHASTVCGYGFSTSPLGSVSK